ncbi:hypothetical protein D3C80_885560 [compost metagenome]
MSLRGNFLQMIDYSGTESQIKRAGDGDGENAFTGEGFELRARQLILHQLQSLSDGPKQLTSSRRRLNTASTAHEQLVVKHQFQPRDRIADCRL